jgi:hypothetical protein
MPLFTIGFETCDDEDAVFAQIFMNAVGVDPLRNLDIVFYAVSDVEPRHLMYGGREMYHEHFQILSGVLHAGFFVANEDRFTLTAKSSASNGVWTQILKAHRINSQWEWRSVIFSEYPWTTSSKVHILRDMSSSGFPWEERRRPILPVLLTDIGQVAARGCSASSVGGRQIRAEKKIFKPQQIYAYQRPFESLQDMVTPFERQIQAGDSILCELDHVNSQSRLWCINPEFSSARRDGFVGSNGRGWLASSVFPASRPLQRGTRIPILVRPPAPFLPQFH